MSLKRLEEIVVGQDMYGHVIGVHYKGSRAFKTRLGALCSIATHVLVLINLMNFITAFLDGSS